MGWGGRREGGGLAEGWRGFGVCFFFGVLFMSEIWGYGRARYEVNDRGIYVGTCDHGRQTQLGLRV